MRDGSEEYQTKNAARRILSRSPGSTAKKIHSHVLVQPGNVRRRLAANTVIEEQLNWIHLV